MLGKERTKIGEADARREARVKTTLKGSEEVHRAREKAEVKRRSREKGHRAVRSAKRDQGVGSQTPCQQPGNRSRLGCFFVVKTLAILSITSSQDISRLLTVLIPDLHSSNSRCSVLVPGSALPNRHPKEPFPRTPPHLPLHLPPRPRLQE